MEITPQKTGDLLTVHLAGRLDASWSGSVQKALDAAIREGEHRIQLDMEKVDYLSSAGLGVLLTIYKELRSINGYFGISKASPFVQSALKLAGLSSLIGQAAKAAAAESETRAMTSPRAAYEIYRLDGRGMTVTAQGDPAALQKGAATDQPVLRFDVSTHALGVGALGSSYADCAPRFGEFLAVAGMAAFQPADGSTRPDFMLSKADFVPEGSLLLGLVARGDFSLLARFEAAKQARTVGLTELAKTALEIAQADAVFVVACAETSGLVGASLRQSPAPAATGDRFGFPQIRDWIAFTGERTHRDSTTLVAGVVAREGHALAPLLRPLGTGLLGHFHATAFPYSPLPKGRLELAATAAALFEASTLQAVLHLLADPREFSGAGESEFLRGALWLAPLTSKIENRDSKIP